MPTAPAVSIVLATHNRRDVVLHTLEQIEQCGLPRDQFEVIVVDNASTDGTPDALRDQPGVHVERLDRNLGSCAKALGVERARGQFVVFLDDDSYPRPGCLVRLLAHFAADAQLGAAGFTVHLPDGTQECSALPHAFVGCGVGFRAGALRQAGGLDLSFFMQAEEYDLSWRLLQAGWKVEVLADLQVKHLKSPTARRSERVTFYDVRNNLRIIGRYLPPTYAEVYREDWLQRYHWIAAQAGHQAAFEQGRAAGEDLAVQERHTYQRWRLSPDVLEHVFCWALIERQMTALYAQGIRRIVLVDLGKNVYAFHRGAGAAGLDALAIADDRLSAPDRTYRDTPLLPTSDALALDAQAYVVSNTSYVHAQRRQAGLAQLTDRPIYNWFPPPGDPAHSVPSTHPSQGVLAMTGSAL